MKETIARVMDERMIDCTTVMKLALYHFDTYMRKEATRAKNLHEIVEDLEKHADPSQQSFVSFALTRPRS